MTDSDHKARIGLLEAENAALRIQVARIPLLESEHTAMRQQILVLEQKLSDLLNKHEQIGCSQRQQ